MADTLKFGPEWLRQLSSGGSMTSPPPSPSFGGKYKLAEYRYGREEMLSLFSPNPKAPDDLKQYTSILIDRCLDPMAMIAPTEEEQLLLASNVNSNAVVRQVMSRSSNERGPPGMRGTGRGVTSIRGRGRGRGEPTAYFQRGGFDDPLLGRGETMRGGRGGREGFSGATKVIERDSSGFLSARTFDESSDRRAKDPFSRSVPGDRWSELRSTSRESGGRLGTSPDTHSEDPSSITSTTGEERSDDWRRAGKGRPARGSWRDSKASFDDETSPRYQRVGGAGGFNRQTSYDRTRPHRPEEDEVLPEWAVDDMGGGDEGGTFDASGAFMSLKDASAEKLNTTPQQNGDPVQRDKKQEAIKARKALPPLSIRQQVPAASAVGDSTTPTTTEKDSGTPTVPAALTQTSTKLRSETPDKMDDQSTSSFSNIPSNSNPNTGTKIEAHSDSSTHASLPAEKGLSLTEELVSAKSAVEPEADFDHLTKAAEEMMATWAAEDDDHPPPVSQRQQPQHSQQQLLHQLQLQQQHPQQLQHQLSNDIVGVEQTEAGHTAPAGPDASSPPELANHWFYKDPQGILQGPFSAQEMAEWFSAGYFTMTLLVKQGRDRLFQPLGEIIKRCGNVQPFVPSTPGAAGLSSPATMIPGVHNSIGNVDPTVLATPQDPIAIQQQQQLFLLQQQQVLLQQQQQMQQLIRQQQQLNQIVERLSASEEYAGLNPQQLQTVAMTLLVKQQQQQQKQQQAIIAQQTQRAMLEANSRNHIPHVNQSSPPQQGSASVIPNSSSATPTPQDEDTLWGAANRSWQKQLRERQAVDEIAQKEAARQQEQQRVELERQQLLEEQRRMEQMRAQEERAKEEIRRQREEMERQQIEQEERKRQEIERQELEKRRQKVKQIELERQRELERQKLLEMERQLEVEKKIELEAKKKAELERQREEEERRHKEAMAAEVARRMEQQREEMERLERERLVAEKERERQMERERLENLQLPSTAQWASGNNASQGSSLLKHQQSLQEIQKNEKEQAKAEADQQRQLQELQEQSQQSQQQTQLKWVANKSQSPVTVGKSLREIQEEEARRLEKERREQQKSALASSTPSASTGTASTWGNNRPSGAGWASEGAWGNAVKKGTWEQPHSKPPKSVNSDVFPSLSAAAASSTKPQNGSGSAQQSQTKKKQSNASTQSSKKSAAAQNDKVQKIFQTAMVTEDKFSEWCAKALQGLNSSIDIPTFVTFLRDVDSPYEVQDYIKNYMGENAKSNQFAKEFLERRSAANKQRQSRQRLEEEESLWGPAPAVNPAAAQRTANSDAAFNMNTSAAAAAAEKKKKSAKKTKGQKMDATALLGFTVGASSHRLNIGEIEKAE